MPDKPKVEFGDEAISMTLQFDKPAKGGVSKYGSWWIWGVECEGEDMVLFTDEDLQGTIESIPPQRGMPVAIQRGKKKGAWKVWTYDGEGWEPVGPAKPAMPPDPAPTPQTVPKAPPASEPPSAPAKTSEPSPAPTKAPVQHQSSQGLSVGEAASVWADCYHRALRVLFPDPTGDAVGTAEMEQARQAATSIFIAVTNDRSSLPKGFQHAPDAAVQKVVEAVDGEVIEGEPGEMQEDDQLPF